MMSKTIVRLCLAIGVAAYPVARARAVDPSASAVKVVRKLDADLETVGSGTVVACEKGRSLILTNRHVCPDSGVGIEVRQGNQTYAAELLGVARKADLAALAVDAELTPAVIAPVEPPDDSPVRQWGFPAQSPMTQKTGHTLGYCGVHQDWGFPMFQTTIEGQPGESGAGVFDDQGRLVAVLFGGSQVGVEYKGRYRPQNTQTAVGLSDVRRFVRKVGAGSGKFPAVARVLAPDTRGYPTHAEGLREARVVGRPLVTYVGDRDPRPNPGAVVAVAPALDGFEDGDVVVTAGGESRAFVGDA